MRTGLWSLPPSWLRTVRVAFLDIYSVANTRSDVAEVSNHLEKKVGGSSGHPGAEVCCQSASLQGPLLFDQLLGIPKPLNDR